MVADPFRFRSRRSLLLNGIVLRSGASRGYSLSPTWCQRARAQNPRPALWPRTLERHNFAHDLHYDRRTWIASQAVDQCDGAMLHSSAKRRRVDQLMKEPPSFDPTSSLPAANGTDKPPLAPAHELPRPVEEDRSFEAEGKT